MERTELSRNYITAYIYHETALPSAAYTVIAKLTEAIEAADAKLTEIFEDEAEDDD
jgi:hypothetical protein